MENENKNIVIPAETAVLEDAKKYSSFRYACGAILAFFGISSKTHRASKKRAKLVGDIFTYIVLLFGAFLMVYPFWWMLAGSFAYTTGGTGGADLLRKMVWWPELDTISGSPKHELFFNYRLLFTNAFQNSGLKASFWRATLNNLIYSIVPVVVGVITSASAAFSFAKIPWFGRNVVFFFLLAAIMVPGPSLMITQYCMYQSMGWVNNPLVLIVPGMFGSIMTAFFIRQFLFGLPTSIIEAAKIDGAGYFRIFCQFILPLAMPAIMAQALLSFMGCWNNYMGSFIYISAQSTWINLPHAMYQLNSQNGDLGILIASSVMCVLPVIILFGCFQKLIIGSLMLTGSKE